MENEIIYLDTSVLIDYYRKKVKAKSFFYELTESYKLFAVSAITEYEILMGSNEAEDSFWTAFFDKIIVLPYTREVNLVAINIYRNLKAKNKLIDIPDLLIGATALKNSLRMATLNRKHFERIDGLTIIDRK